MSRTGLALPLTLTVVTVGGCNFGGDPECLAVVERNDSQVQFSGTNYECGWTSSPEGLTRMSFGSGDGLYITFNEPPSTMTEYAVDVSVNLAGDTYRNEEGQACLLTLARYDIEDWTQYDRHALNGTVTCANPLWTIFEGDPSVSINQIVFDMYAWNDADRYGAGV